MKIEKLSSTKLKITLSSQDAYKWDINIDRLSKNSPQLQELFWSIMKQAEKEHAFYAEGSQLFIEAVTTRTDGFIFVVTKLSSDKTDPIKKLKTKTNRHLSTGTTPRTKNAPVIFKFDDFDSAVTGCKQISNTFRGESSLYKYEQKYYLVLKAATSITVNKCGNRLTEYGKYIPHPSLVEGKLSEHGKILIYSTAVESFCSFF